MESLKYLFMAVVIGALSACASNTYKVQSTPSEADVDFVFKSGARKSVGKTPVSLNASEFNPNRESFLIEVKKEGFNQQSVFVPESYFSKSIETNINLQPATGAIDPHKGEAALNEVATAVADIQKDIQTKNYEIAMSKLNRMVAQYPNVSTFYSLTGNVHYLEKRLDRALSSYRKALSLNPGSSDLQKVIEKIEGLTGGSR